MLSVLYILKNFCNSLLHTVIQ